MYKFLSEKYKNEKDTENYKLGKIYLKKLCSNLFKVFYYSANSIIGYLILKQLNYFPTILGGNGAFEKMYEPGNPDFYFHWKPDYFNIYYLSALSYCLTDLIWLLFIYEAQSDFILMLLHHTCTISLVSFSYLTNYSNIGAIVLFIHDVGDIFVNLIRITINSDAKSIITEIQGVILILVFIYTRIFVFLKLIISIWCGLNWEWHFVTKCLWFFLTFLYIMHINWVCLIFNKLYNAFVKKKRIDEEYTLKVEKQR